MRYDLDLAGEYWLYLRKSRADLEAEARGEGETLSKHRKALFKLGKDLRINITEVFEEIVSGESLFHRPEMLSLMDKMEKRRPKGVLVMDMDRLGRGNMQEQGLILETFRKHQTLIITPSKIYNLNDESDELMTEVQSLFARQELKMITRRMQRGRKASVEEGNYIATRPPYGYLIHKEGRNRFLVPHPEQAPVVRRIFEMYVKERLGSSKIANRLNELRLPSYDGRSWEPSTILTILKNEVYLGRLQWGKKEQKKSRTPGKKRDTRTRDRDEWIDTTGKHDPLVEEGLFIAAREIRTNRDIVPFDVASKKITNPLSGLVRCGKCGHSMVMRPYGKQKPHLICSNQNRSECDNKSSRFEYIETGVMDLIETYLNEFKMNYGKYKRENRSDNNVAFKQSAIESLERELKETEMQKERAHEAFEKGVYDADTFLNRSRSIVEKMSEIKSSIDKLKIEIEQDKKKQKANKDIMPMLKKAITVYHKTDDPAKKNAILKSVIKEVTYTKEKHQRNDEFNLELTPRFKV